MVVEAVVLLRLQDHRAERLELRDLPRQETLPCHIELIRLSTVPAQNDSEYVRGYNLQISPKKLVVGVLLHHLPKEGKARRLNHFPHRQQHL